MNVSSPTCKFLTGSSLESGYMFQSQPQYLIQNKEFETHSHIQHPAFKKPRTTSDIVPKSTMPVALNRAMSDNFKTGFRSNCSLSHCSNGDKCQFAHGIGGVRNHLPHWRGHVGEDNRIGNGDYKMSHETKICRMFYNGQKCTYEDRCRFLHVSPENVKQDLGLVRESSVISVMNTSGFSGDKRSGFGRLDGKGFVNLRSIGDRVNSKPVAWKTKLCNNWEMTGGCAYGKICYFAHGQAELQKFGSHSALESGIAPPNCIKIFPTAKNGTGTSYKQQVQGMESIFKWKEIEKIRGIYADWIEDMPFLLGSSNKVEN